jgi:hypothetical protein
MLRTASFRTARSRATFAAALCLASLTACQSPAACPAIAAAPFVTIHITADRSATLAALSATACQDGTCHGGPLALMDEQTPDGTLGKVGHVDMGTLSEAPIDLTVSGRDLAGQAIGAYRLRLIPRTEYPWGRDCPRVVVAQATLDASGLTAG